MPRNPFRYGLLGKHGKRVKVAAVPGDGRALLSDGSVGYPTPADHTHPPADIEGLPELDERVTNVEEAVGVTADQGLSTTGDVLIDNPERGLVLRSEDGRYFRLTVNGLGDLRAVDLGTEPPATPQ
jgi:hypothetical protein